jgi:threonine synthase
MSFEQVVLGGLATDKGLFIPETIPSISMQEIENVSSISSLCQSCHIAVHVISIVCLASFSIQMRGMNYVDLAYTVISKFVGPEDVPADALKGILTRSFSSFRTPEVAPSVKYNDCWVLELFHGPTFAFKDVALQFLGNLFEFFMLRGNIQSNITILGATSGDTGSAAIYGLRGKKNVNCFIMFPKGKVTQIQERQMTTIADENIQCISIDGDFDDCQSIVKAAFNDEAFRKEVNLGAINSINWARVLAQITYYFYSYLRVTDKLSPQERETFKPSFAVPTGNFGDILAGFYAKKMGLPVDKLVVATNQNDVLHRFLQSGTYKKNPAVLTIAPSMDISVSSNFERYLYYLSGENTATLASWMGQFESSGELSVPPQALQLAQSEFLSCSSDKSQILEMMTDVYTKENYLLCPHTATAFVACRKLKLPPESTVSLATAHPAKFEEAVQLALQNFTVPQPPEALAKLFALTTRSTFLPNSLPRVQAFMRDKIAKAGKGVCQCPLSSPLFISFAAAAALFGFAVLSTQRLK